MQDSSVVLLTSRRVLPEMATQSQCGLCGALGGAEKQCAFMDMWAAKEHVPQNMLVCQCYNLQISPNGKGYSIRHRSSHRNDAQTLNGR